MKIKGLAELLAIFAAVSSLNFGCASAPYDVKFEQEEYPVGFLYSLSVAKKQENHGLKIIWPEIREVPEAERSNVVSRIEKEMNDVYDAEKIKELGLTFYVMKTSAPSKTGKLRDIPYNLRFRGSSVNTIATNNLEETIHKAVFLTYFNGLSNTEQEEFRKTYGYLRPSSEKQADALAEGKWDCYIAQRYAGIVMGAITPSDSDKLVVDFMRTYKKSK